jgi:hypothetical protein
MYTDMYKYVCDVCLCIYTYIYLYVCIYVMCIKIYMYAFTDSNYYVYILRV